MKVRHFIFSLSVFVIALLLVLVGCSHADHTITWQDEDGTFLAQTHCPDGEVPQYPNDTPTKAADAHYTYTFVGWDKELSAAKQNATYVAQYKKSIRSYTVCWKYKDGTLLHEETLPYGATPQYDLLPDPTLDHQFQTSFSQWSPAIGTVTGDAEYTAEYETSMVFPALYVTVEGEITDSYSSCSITTRTADKNYEIEGALAQIKVRGNGTAQYQKKPYRIKFDKKQTMFGLNDGLRAKSWVLLAEYTDRTMLKNATAFYLARQILETDGYYVSDSMFVEVYLNDEYNGLYLLAEQQQVNEGRIAIEESSKKSPTIHTGYLVEMDNYALSEEVYFTLTYSPLKFINSETTTNRLQTRYTVKSDVYTDEQKEFIQRKLQNTWLAIYDAAYTDRSQAFIPYYTLNQNGDLIQDLTIRSAQEAVARLIDLRSLTDTWILQEICENIDVGWSSFFISVDCSERGNAKLTFQAPWDFDWALGQTGYIPNGFYSVAANGNAPNIYNPWLLVVCNQQWFLDLAAERWKELNANADLIQGAIEQIDLYYTEGKTAFDRNFETWPDIMTYVHPTHTSSEYAAATTQGDAVAWLKSFLSYRKTFLNGVFQTKE